MKATKTLTMALLGLDGLVLASRDNYRNLDVRDNEYDLYTRDLDLLEEILLYAREMRDDLSSRDLNDLLIDPVRLQARTGQEASQSTRQTHTQRQGDNQPAHGASTVKPTESAEGAGADPEPVSQLTPPPLSQNEHWQEYLRMLSSGKSAAEDRQKPNGRNGGN